MKLIFSFSFLLFGFACGNEEDFRRLDGVKQEPLCSASGGICMPRGDCPPDQLSEKRGLCPRQRPNGVECCQGLSPKETRCRKRGGACLSLDLHCNPKQVFKEAIDCPNGTNCCIMTL